LRGHACWLHHVRRAAAESTARKYCTDAQKPACSKSRSLAHGEVFARRRESIIFFSQQNERVRAGRALLPAAGGYRFEPSVLQLAAQVVVRAARCGFRVQGFQTRAARCGRRPLWRIPTQLLSVSCCVDLAVGLPAASFVALPLAAVPAAAAILQAPLLTTAAPLAVKPKCKATCSRQPAWQGPSCCGGCPPVQPAAPCSGGVPHGRQLHCSVKSPPVQPRDTLPQNLSRVLRSFAAQEGFLTRPTQPENAGKAGRAGGPQGMTEGQAWKGNECRAGTPAGGGRTLLRSRLAGSPGAATRCQAALHPAHVAAQAKPQPAVPCAARRESLPCPARPRLSSPGGCMGCSSVAAADAGPAPPPCGSGRLAARCDLRRGVPPRARESGAASAPRPHSRARMQP
jgi:hypothetical protein